MRNHRLIFLILVSLSNISFGQKVYRVNNEAYRANKFTREFYILKDSTCYLKEQVADYSTYALYKGSLKKINDTLSEFRYQPIAEFGSNMRFLNGDSLNFEIEQKDTSLTSFTYQLKTNNNVEKTVNLQPGMSTLYIKGFQDKAYFMTTKFRDPLTKKMISITISRESEPTLTYYGTNTHFQTVPVSILANKLTIYPDREHVFEKETFLLITK